jgi:hypothetical protein
LKGIGRFLTEGSATYTARDVIDKLLGPTLRVTNPPCRPPHASLPRSRTNDGSFGLPDSASRIHETEQEPFCKCFSFSHARFPDYFRSWDRCRPSPQQPEQSLMSLRLLPCLWHHGYPRVDQNACPFEGCQFGKLTANTPRLSHFQTPPTTPALLVFSAQLPSTQC